MPTEVVMKINESALKDMFSAIFDSTATDSTKTTTTPTTASEEKRINMDMSFKIELILKVVSVKGGQYKFEAYYDYLESSVSSDKDKFSYNTRENTNSDAFLPEQKEELDAIKSIIGKKFSITTNKKGKVISISNYDKAIANIKLKKEQNMPMQGKKSLLIDQLQNQELQNKISSIMDILPTQPVGIGDTWEKELNVDDQLIPYVVKTIYTLKEINTNNVIIATQTNIIAEKTKLGSIGGNGNSIITLSKQDIFSQTQQYNLGLIIQMALFGIETEMLSKGHGTYEVKLQ